MSKVFITKYPTSVNNDKLPVYGKIRIGINVSSPTNICIYQINEPIDAIGGNFLQKDLSTVIGNHLDTYNGDVYVDSNVSGILINKYGLDGNIYFNNSNNVYDVDISEFRYSKLSYFQIIGKGVTGDISSLSSIPKLTVLSIGTTSVTGDISSLSSMSQLTSLNVIDNKGVTGDISSLSSMSQLTTLNVVDTNVTGDISSLSSMSNLTSLNVAGTNVTGDISGIINNLTALKQLVISPKITITDEQKTTLTNRGCTVIIR